MGKNAKLVKMILMIPLSVILLIFLVLLVTPMLFKDQIMELAKTELNKMLAARVDFKDLQLSFIRNFPNAYVGLEGVEVTGTGDFEGELLAAFDKFSVTVDIMSVIKMDNIEVKSILLDRARLNGHVLEDGRANWDIMKPGEEKEPVEEIEKAVEEIEKTAAADEAAEEAAASPFVFKVGLRKFEIRDLQASFRDEAQKMSAGIQALNFTLRGDMKRENVTLKLELGIDGIDFWMDGVHLANKAGVGFVSEIAADLKNMNFTLKNNKFNLNDIVLKFSGSAGMQGDDINADIAFATERTDFKSLLSLVPAVYMNDFKNIKTSGILALSGDIKGTYNKKMMPSANVALSVENAAFSYPDLPKSVEKINIALKARYDGEVFDRTTADVDRFSFEMAGNPFNAEFHVKTPESDPQLAAKFAGKIDFNSVSDIIPLDDMTLSGLLECDIALAGKLSTLQKEQYEDFQAAGSLKLSGFDFKSPDFPQGAKITNMQLNFTPRRVELANFGAIVGNTDVALNGSLENFIPFVFKKETVKGTLALRSNTIDLNEFMGGEPSEEKEKKEEKNPEEASELSVIEVPKNINFALTVNIGKIFFDKLAITNTSGAVTVKDGRLLLQNLGMNLLEGGMTINGEYNTENIKAPFIDFGLNIRQFDISSALSSFSMLEKILPEPQNYAGKVSASLTLNSALDGHLSPVLDSVVSKGSLQTQNLQIRNSKIFGSVADFLKNENWRNPSPGNISVGFEIKDGRVWIEKPIVMNMPPARMEISGDMGLDTSLNYKIDTIVPTSAIGSGAASLLSSIPGGSRINQIKVTGLVRGTAKNPEVSLSMADMASSITDAVKDQVVQTVTKKAEEVKTQVSAEVNRQIDQLIAEAQKQATNIRTAAKQAADKTRRDSNAAADKLISDASKKSVLEKQVAKVAADKLRTEGEASAKKLEQEGEKNAQAALTAAQKKADELKKK